jgi:hypothetical protein
MIQIIIQSNFTRYVNDLLQIQLTDSDLIGISVVGTSAILFLILLYIINKSQENEVELNQEFNKTNTEVKKAKTAKKDTSKGRPGVKEEISLSNKKRTDQQKLSDKSSELLDHNFNDVSKEKETNDPGDSKVEDKATSYQSADNSEKSIRKIRKNGSEQLDKAIQKTENNDGTLYIGYKPSDKFRQAEDWNYVVVKMPKEGSVIKQPVQGKQQLRGYKEQDFQKQIESFLQDDFSISGNAIISTGDETRPYEPDIFLSYLGNHENIFIDIEIDEPYGGVQRNGTHIKGEDDIRDYYFADRGWIVIRFAEIQVHQQPKECVGLIAKVINEIALDINLPLELLEMSLPTAVEQWDLLQGGL